MTTERHEAHLKALEHAFVALLDVLQRDGLVHLNEVVRKIRATGTDLSMTPDSPSARATGQELLRLAERLR